MVFLKIFVYIFFAYGLTEIVVFGRGPFGLCEKWRALAHSISDGFGELFDCPMCFSMWVGMIFSVANMLLIPSVAFTPFNVIFMSLNNPWIDILSVFMDGFFTSGIVWLLFKIEDALTAKIEYKADEYEFPDDEQ